MAASATAEREGTTTLFIPADHVRQFRICLIITMENAAEELSHLTCHDNCDRAEAAIGHYHRIVRTGPLLDQLGWLDLPAEGSLELTGAPDALAAACREAHEWVTPPAKEAVEKRRFLEWLEALPWAESAVV
jgi:hypothetical protein